MPSTSNSDHAPTAVINAAPTNIDDSVTVTSRKMSQSSLELGPQFTQQVTINTQRVSVKAMSSVGTAYSPPRISQKSAATIMFEPTTKDDSHAGMGLAMSSRPTVRKSMIKAEQKMIEAEKNKVVVSRSVTISRKIVENKWFTLLTMLLTLYALVGDDIRIMSTEEPADDAFNLITIFCIVVFCIEIILSCVGKDDYLGGFFFILDCVSTSTLSLDLTWVSEALQSDEEDLDSMGSAKTFQTGARLARVVRVLRLVRILKLYKAIYEAQAAQKRQMDRMTAPGEDDDWEHAENHDELRAKAESLQRGSRVGKRLSELTIRKVIILVLCMMLFLKIVRVDMADQFAFAPYYGADLVHESFALWEGSNFNSAYLRDAYVKQMLQFIYYNNWYTGHADHCPIRGDNYGCPVDYSNQVFWVGLVSQESDTNLPAIAAKARLTPEEVSKWEAEVVATQRDQYNFGSMPPQVLKTLGSPWTQVCNSGDIYRLGFSLLREESDMVSYAVSCPETGEGTNGLRKAEREKFSARVISKAKAKEWHFAFYFDKRKFTHEDSMYSILVTLLCVVVLTFAAILFTNDADRLVLGPLEVMISKVERIRDNPLMAMKMSDDEFRQEEVRKHKESKKDEQRSQSQVIQDILLCKGEKKVAEPMETVILEKTIIKIGSLLALGFGQAGANIIEENMSGGESAMVTAMVAGEKVDCIVGCARIAEFGVFTEILKGVVMTFVNQVSEIVHGVTDAFAGAPNKNTGSIFYLIWRTSDLDEGYGHKAADMAVFAVTRILGSVHRSPALAQYRAHPGLQQRLKDRPNGCRVNMSFALHYGWAIEGAVGSEFKIDASYLSPNVSIVASLETATNIYGVPILVSERVIKLCTPEMAGKCRLIDKVTLTAMTQGETMELYAVDVDCSCLYVQKPVALPPWNPRQRFKVRQFLEMEKGSKWSHDIDIVHLFHEDADISAMRFRYTLEFTHVFNMGYVNYAEGEWQVAQRFLNLTRQMLGVEDGPSAALLHYMEKHRDPYEFEAPLDWNGVRDLGQDIANSAFER